MRLYFCSDIHASEACWRKFLATPKFYEADVIIVGGDITGKFVVPIIQQASGAWTAQFMGIERKVRNQTELGVLKRQIADAGQYGFETSPDEYAHYSADQTRVDELFKRLALERVAEWMQLADERLRGTGVRCLVSGANDDFFEVDALLAQSDLVEDPNCRVLDLDGGLQLMGMGYGNPTPWPCPRDIPEEELAARIFEVSAGLSNPERAIMSLHVPPYDSTLDIAPRLDEQLRMVMNAGGPEMIPVGSTAVRDALLSFQPLLSLHGHIHESKGIRKMGKSIAVNPGSEYAEGILDGVLVDIDPRRLTLHTQLVSG
ncbi:MAG TPA: hypothetical protein VMV12_00535 [Candidatus Micrarchaeaceae archaeon]|jgi:Icc-related predicted phosphoesterase|nr:hypothetical protein [Candidatus Micrarchaeaceae archaeon]